MHLVILFCSELAALDVCSNGDGVTRVLPSLCWNMRYTSYQTTESTGGPSKDFIDSDVELSELGGGGMTTALGSFESR